MDRAHGRLFQPNARGLNTAPFFGAVNPGALYLAGLSPVTIATGVSRWSDVSGNGLDLTQATVGNQPAYPANTFVSMPGVDYDGSDDALSVAAAAAINDLWDGGGYLVAVIRKDGNGGGGFGNLIGKENAGLSTGWIIYSAMGFQQQFSTTDGLWTWAVSSSVPFILELEYNADATTNDPTVRVNGSAVTVTESVTPVGTRVSDASDALVVGNRPILTRGWDGPIGAMGLYTSIPGTSQKAQIRAALGAMYGITTA